MGPSFAFAGARPRAYWLGLVVALGACSAGGAARDVSTADIAEPDGFVLDTAEVLEADAPSPEVLPEPSGEVAGDATTDAPGEGAPDLPAEAVADTGPDAGGDALFSRPLNPWGALIPSSWAEPESSPSDYYAYDDFTLDVDAQVTEVTWLGGYTQGAQSGHAVDFTLTFYDSAAAGTQPHVVPPNLEETYLAEYRVGGDAGETPAGTLGATPLYAYRHVLPTPFAVQAGVHYWLRIEASQSPWPDWGIAPGTGGDDRYYRYSYANLMFQWAPGDTAFTLR